MGIDRRDFVLIGSHVIVSFAAAVGISLAAYRVSAPMVASSEDKVAITVTKLHKTSIVVTDRTRRNFPAIEDINDYLQGEVEHLYIIAPEDIAVTLELKHALRVVHDCEEGKITSDERDQYFNDHDIIAKMKQRLSIYLSRYEGVLESLTDEDLTDLAKSVLLGEASVRPFTRNISAPSFDSAFMVLPSQRHSKRAYAADTSGLSVESYEEDDVPGTQQEVLILHLAHELGHMLHRFAAAPMQGDVNADGFTGRFYSQAIAKGRARAIILYAYHLALRAVGSIVKYDGYQHATNAAIGYGKKHKPPAVSPVTMEKGRRQAIETIASEIGGESGSSQDWLPIIDKILQGSDEPYPGYSRVYLKAGDDIILRKIAATIAARDLGSLAALYEQLSPGTYQGLMSMLRDHDIKLGLNVMKYYPSRLYTTALKLYQEGAFDDNKTGKHYVWDLIEAANTHLQAQFGVVEQPPALTPPDEIAKPAPAGAAPAPVQ
jgi:hypothetical protein